MTVPSNHITFKGAHKTSGYYYTSWQARLPGWQQYQHCQSPYGTIAKYRTRVTANGTSFAQPAVRLASMGTEECSCYLQPTTTTQHTCNNMLLCTTMRNAPQNPSSLFKAPTGSHNKYNHPCSTTMQPMPTHQTLKSIYHKKYDRHQISKCTCKQ